MLIFFNFRSSNPGSGSGIRIRNPDPEYGSAIRKNTGSGSVSGSALNQCGSETLNKSHQMRPLSDRSMSLDSICNYPDPCPGKKKAHQREKIKNFGDSYFEELESLWALEASHGAWNPSQRSNRNVKHCHFQWQTI